MRRFGMEFLEKPLSSQVPRGFSPAKIFLGKETEFVHSSVRIWGHGDYMSHWKETSIGVINKSSPPVFCSSADNDGFDLWIASSDGRALTFYNFVYPAKAVKICGFIIEISDYKETITTQTQNASSWVVELDLVAKVAASWS